MKIKSCPIFLEIRTSVKSRLKTAVGGMCRGTWFVSVMPSPGAITSSWEPDSFGQQGAWRGKEITVSCKMRTKQEIWTSMSYNVITMRLFIPTGQMPLLLKLERMFMVTLVGSQPVFSSLGTEDKKTSVIFLPQMSPLQWGSTEIAKTVTLVFTLIKS